MVQLAGCSNAFSESKVEDIVSSSSDTGAHMHHQHTGQTRVVHGLGRPACWVGSRRVDLRFFLKFSLG